jgi:hypothetical protein
VLLPGNVIHRVFHHSGVFKRMTIDLRIINANGNNFRKFDSSGDVEIELIKTQWQDLGKRGRFSCLVHVSVSTELRGKLG